MAATANNMATDGRPTPGYGPIDWVAQLGAGVIDLVASIGGMCVFTLQAMRWLVTRRPARGTLTVSFYRIGVLTLPVVALTGTFIGMVLASQAYFQFHSLNLETRLGAVINMSLLRELGPVLAATMLAGRVGSAMAAELGTMRVTDQIDALASMGVNPVHYLVVPRFLGCLILIPALTIMADFMGVAGGMFYSTSVLGIDAHHYLENSRQFVEAYDLFVGIFKSFFFGATIALIGCYRGFYCRPGAEGVGHAATGAFVHAFVVILIIDFFLGATLDNIYLLLWPDGPSLLR